MLVQLDTTKNYRGEIVPVYMLCGKVSKDGETGVTKNGKTYGKCSVIGRETNQGTDFVTVTGYGNSANVLASLKKGTQVLVIGSCRESDYNGRKYIYMDADFISKSAWSKQPEGQTIEDVADKFKTLTEENGQLPF